MAISVFPAGGGEFVTNDFVVDMNDTTNNVIDLGRTFAAGVYEITFTSAEAAYDLYAVTDEGELAGYTQTSTLITDAGFSQIAVLGVATNNVITFAFSGSSTDANAEGTSVGAGAYLESVSPSDLPNQNDTTTVTGGNFASDVEIFFESGATSTEAKNIARNDSTELIVTRPDALDPSLDPWSLRAVNPGVPEPTATNANILVDVIEAGALPVWVTTSPLTFGKLGQAYSETVEATDADGAVAYSLTLGSLPTGLSLDSSTGVISGTPTANNGAFTLTATDEGGNENDREFTIPLAVATGGTITSANGYIIHTFETTDDFIPSQTINNVEYLVVAGGGAGGDFGGDNRFDSGGGGAGGLRSSINGEVSGGGASSENKVQVTSQTYTITVGAGGSGGNGQGGPGGSSTFGNLVATVGGGGGAEGDEGAGSGGSGGGAGSTDNSASGSGTAGEGFSGGGPTNAGSGGGGGAGQQGQIPLGGAGVTSSANGSAVEYAPGGRGATNTQQAFAYGAGGNGRTGGGGIGFDGENGIVIVRYQ